MEGESRAAPNQELFEEQHQHGSSCSYCPICSAITILRKTRPEVVDHLASAAREFIVAMGLLIDEAEDMIAAVDGRPASDADEHQAKVRRIDIG